MIRFAFIPFILLAGILSVARAQTRATEPGYSSRPDSVAARSPSPEPSPEPVNQEAMWSWDALDISSRGSVRLQDLLRTLHPLDAWSNDRYTLRIVGTGMGGLHGSPPVVILDGLAMPFVFLGRSLSEFIPVTPSEITRLSFDPGLSILPKNRLADGVIEIRTDKPRGLLFSGTGALINETGDPGPALHQDSTLSNVDRSGPATNLHLSYGTASWFFQLGLNADLYHLTDDLTSGRMFRVFAAEKQPIVTVFAPNVRISHESARAGLEIRGGSARKKDHLFSEFSGWEWPSRQQWDWGKILGKLHSSRRTSIGFRGSVDRFQTENRSANIVLPPDLHFEHSSGEIFVGLRQNSGQNRRGGPKGEDQISPPVLEIAVGGTLDEVEQDETEIRLRERNLFSRVSLRLRSEHSSWKLIASQAYAQSNSLHGGVSSTAVESSLDHTWQGGRSIRFTSSYFRGIDFDLWSTRELAAGGVSFGEWTPNLIYSTQRTREQKLDVGLTLFQSLSENLTFWVRMGVRYAAGLTIPNRTIRQPFQVGAFLVNSSFVSGRSGWIFARSLGFDIDRDKTRARLSYQFYHVSSNGDEIFWRHFTGFPRHKLAISASSEAFERILLHGALRLNSKRKWPEYLDADRRKIPTQVELEATASKNMFGPRMRLAVSFLNISDSSLGNHPAGVIEQFAVRLALTTRFARPTRPGAASPEIQDSPTP